LIYSSQEPELSLLRGWLKKKIQASDSKFLKKWQKRFVEVRQSSLVYYKNQQQVLDCPIPTFPEFTHSSLYD
jgi:hypothetical protein